MADMVGQISARWPGLLVDRGQQIVTFAPFEEAKAIFLKTPSPCDELWVRVLTLLITKRNDRVEAFMDVITSKIANDVANGVPIEGVNLISDWKGKTDDDTAFVINKPYEVFMAVGGKLGYDLQMLDVYLTHGGDFWPGSSIQ